MNKEKYKIDASPRAAPDAYGSEARKAMACVQSLQKQPLPLMTGLGNKKSLAEIKSIAAKITPFKNLVVFGTGGSSLTGQALTGIKSHKKNATRIYFSENIDPHSFHDLIDNLNLKDTFFLVISKSGRTIETISQFSSTIEIFKKKAPKANLKKHFLVITDPGKNPLRKFAYGLGMEIANHNPDIGGRFSIFTNVALIPAAVAGLDIDAIIKGATTSLRNFFGAKNSAPVTGAILHKNMMQKGFSCNVMMPYIDRLYGFADWYRQLWAESIGKNGLGSTPLKAFGTIDQHSQLQLYLEGPRDKFFTIISTPTAGQGQKLDSTFLSDKEISYLKGKTIGDILEAELKATKQCLIDRGCPVREFALEKFDEESLGALAMHFILETIVTAHILGIDPFDQPAVEKVKLLIRKNLTRT